MWLVVMYCERSKMDFDGTVILYLPLGINLGVETSFTIENSLLSCMKERRLVTGVD